MDPLTIAAGCASLIGTIARLSLTISRFVRDMRGARSDMDSISRELSSLKSVLELLEEDAKEGDSGSGHTSAFPETLQQKISGIMSNCNGVLDKIVAVLEKHSINRIDRNARWVMSGREEVNELRSSLETHKTALEIALDMVQLRISRDIRNDTSHIRNDTATIVEDTRTIREVMEQLLQEVAQLRSQMARQDDQRHVQDEAVVREQNSMIQRYLDDLTSYAETVVGDEDTAGLEEPHFEANEIPTRPAESQNPSGNEHEQATRDEQQRPNGATDPSNISGTRPAAEAPDPFDSEKKAQENETQNPNNKSTEAPHNPDQSGSSEIWEMTTTQKKAFIRMFRRQLSPGSGCIDKDVLFRIGHDNGLSKEELSRIWSLADSRATGMLTQNEFAIAMFLIKTQLRPSPPPLPSSVPEALRVSCIYPVERGVPVVQLAPRKFFFSRIFRH
ncbi:hypothetical protein K432DRAFT_178857 [Lepidopterella palustris CBS 459.81]|uniref:EH domain-containing protein n=1 Tax=Lepidopterella palustris CBS 459.81 TaxID=1314670 RepID=A0A8E2E0J5_9PEZI|nr:hypothetical protein K432DRAFT_178857 [Lepidopterella palustris CBS 459.81]